MERVNEEEGFSTLLIKEGTSKYDDEGNSYNRDGPSSAAVSFMVVFSTIVAVCGSFALGTALGYSSPAETGIVDDLGLTSAEYSFFGSVLTIGGMIGAVLSGKVADLFGRKYAMGISEMFCVIGWLGIVFAKDALWLDLGRFSVGCGVGLFSFVVPAYVAEITTETVRGAFTSSGQLMIGSGKALTFAVGSLVNWRTLALIGILPCVLQFLGLIFIPESPRWLAKTGRMREFEAALQQLRGKHADISQEAADIKEYTEYLQKISDDGILSLFQRRYVHPLIVGVGLMVFEECVGLNAFTFYASIIFESADRFSRHCNSLLSFPSKVGTIAAAVVQIVMTAFGVMLIDKCGRRPLLLVSLAGAFLGCMCAGFSFFLQDLHSGKELIAILVLVGVLVFIASFELGMGGIPWIMISEIFSINIKGSAGGLVTLVSWFGGWIIAYVFTFLFEWSSAGTFFIFAGFCAAGALFVVEFVPETKGRSLEEIQESMMTMH